MLILIGIYLYDVRGGKRNKVEFFYFVIFLLSITTGLSYRLGIDMTRYMDNYVDYKSLFKIDSFDYFFPFKVRLHYGCLQRLVLELLACPFLYSICFKRCS